MPAQFLSRVLVPATAGALVVTCLAAGGTTADAATSASRGNPTGTAAGSKPNGSSYLKVGLATTSDGRIKVSWTRPAAPSRLSRFIVKVGVNRSMNVKVHSYAVNRTKQSVVLDTAFGASPSSGNFSFVKVYVKRKDGSVGSSPTKWIQTPLKAGCPSGTNRVNVGTFNVRTWGGSSKVPKRFRWSKRGPRVVHEILRSGAHAVAIQEASGRANSGYGRLRQNRWIVSRLNAADPKAHWTDINPADAYAGEGLVGTRVFYDTKKFDLLSSGLKRIKVPHVKSAYAPWARLQAVDKSTSPFVLISTHLEVGDSAYKARVRNRQIGAVIDLSKRLHSRYGGQVILGGDFNSTGDTRPYNTVQVALLRAGFYDSFATSRLANSKYASTNNFDFPVIPSPHRRDLIMSFGSIKGSCRHVNLAYTRSSQVASDHFMQVATLPLG